MRRFPALTLVAVTAVFITFSAFAQSSGSLPPQGLSNDGVWKEVEASSLASGAGERTVVPKAYRTFELDRPALASLLAGAPAEEEARGGVDPVVLSIPRPDGGFALFAVVDSPIFEPALARAHPELKTYAGQGIDDPAATARLDLVPDGFHAMVLSPEGAYFVDPYRFRDDRHYVAYWTRDFEKPAWARAGCTGIISPPEGTPWLDRAASAAKAMAPESTTGPNLRTYRAAVACTGEYSAYQTAQGRTPLAAITTSMNRVSGIYEVDMAIRMVLVANESAIIYTDASSDPYTNGNPSSLLSQNQSNLDSVIGSGNYDIGHVFSTAGGGLAGLGVVCKSGQKAWGETGTGAPYGDPFDVDYVAHEMGHQFGANHTFNGTTSSCGGGNRAASAAYEPGSASTIMGYAGICGAEDLQPHSDPYFHAKSFDEIQAYVDTQSCQVTTATGNQTPTVSAGASYTVPANTPFALTATGSDPNGDSVTYCWEEFDLGSSSPPSTDNGNRPLFRSWNPVTGPTRVFPRLADVLNNANVPSIFGEVVPTTSRTMTYRVTARDNRPGGGGVNWSTTTVTTSSGAGPFTVTAPNTAVSWTGGTAQTVTWNVAGTAAAPVSAANVKISLSADGGATWPTVLAASTPNDGSEGITVPNISTTTARIKVEGASNVFFDVSNANFTIVAGSTQPNLSLGAISNAILGGDGDANFEPGESGALTIPLSNGGTIEATTVTATLASSTPGVTVVTTQAVPYPSLPGSGAPGSNAVPFIVSLSTAATCGAQAAFTLTVTYSGGGGPAVLPFTLPIGGSGTATTTFSYTGPAVSIPDNAAGGVSTALTASGFAGPITDVNFRFDGSACSPAAGSTTVGLDHTWVGDLVVKLTSPGGTTVTLMDRPGGASNDGNNFCNTVLDGAASAPIQSIAPAGNPWSGTYTPSSALSAFNGQSPNGTWTLNVADLNRHESGSVRAWSLVIAASSGCDAPAPHPGAVPDRESLGTPFTLAKSGGDLTLAWGASCDPAGVDYAVYQGTIGTWYGHASQTCTTQGLTSRTLAMPPGNVYFLVAAETADSEGSCGTSSTGVQIPAATSPCKPQLTGGCP